MLQRSTGTPTAPFDKRLTPLRRRLERSRARARGLLLLRGTLWSAVVASSTYLGLRLVTVWWPVSWTASAWATLVFVAAFTIGVLWALRRTPSLLELAQRADRRFALRERTSTALELARSQPSKGAQGELATALLEDATRHAARIEPRQLVPFIFPREGWVVVALTAVVITVQFGVPQASLGGPGADPAVAEGLSEAERVETVADLRRAAQLLDSEAEERNDPYLQALARAFDTLGRRVEANELDRNLTQLELERLMAHVARAYGSELGQDEAGGEPGLPGAALGTPSTPSPDASLQEQVSREAAPTGGEASQWTSEPEGSAAALDELVRSLEGLEAQRQEAKARREVRDGQAAVCAYGCIDPEVRERLEREWETREALRAEAAGRPVGAAQEAGRGAGDLAGEGVQPLAGEGETPDFLETETQADEVLLPDNDAGQGEHVRLELPPETRLSEVADSPRSPGEVWRARQVAVLRRESLSPRDRAVASHYFAPGDAAPPTEPEP